jgi:hypothetical protein
MANEIITMLQGSVAAIQVGVDDDTRAVAGNSGAKRLSIDGGVFRKYVGGKQVAEVEDRSMNVIFVKMAHNPSRTYYAGAYQKGVKISPACWSQDAQTPDAAVKNPKAASCRDCPMSVKGSGQGGMGTACRLSWRTAVVLPQDPTGDVMQLVLPATSVFGDEDAGRWPFKAYVQMLANNNISASRVVTKMQFDTKASVPRLLFSPIAPVNAEDLEALMRQGKSDASEKAIKLTVYQSDGGGSAAEEVEVEAPVDAPVAQQAAVQEPVLRQPAATPPSSDAVSVINKWKKK